MSSSSHTSLGLPSYLEITHTNETSMNDISIKPLGFFLLISIPSIVCFVAGFLYKNSKR